MRPEERVHEPWLEHNLDHVRSDFNWLDEQVKGPWINGEKLTQAGGTTVVMYDFLRLFERCDITAESHL